MQVERARGGGAVGEQANINGGWLRLKYSTKLSRPWKRERDGGGGGSYQQENREGEDGE